MKILISEKFKKSVPNEKKDFVIEKIRQLEEELKRLEEEKQSIRNIKKGFSIWKLKPAKENIYKFRVDEANRIIFTYTKYLKNWDKDEFEDDNNILILEYCVHDEQVRRGRSLDLDVGGYIDLDDIDLTDEEANVLYDPEDEKYNTYYNPSDDKISIYSDEDLKNIFGLNSREEIYKLNEEQKVVLRSECPVFLFGSAGSGKTTIGVRKIRSIYNSNDNMRIGYFTFSKKLKEETKDLFEYLEKFSENHTTSSIDFYSLEEFLTNSTNVKRPFKYRRFKDWIYTENIQKHMQIEDYDLSELYREIRGIIKGMIGIEWCKNDPNLYKKVLMDKDEYINIKPEYSSFKDKEKAYSLAERYQKYLDKENLKDDNDLAREVIEKIENGEIEKYDFIVVDEIQDLTEKQIYMIYKLVKNSKNVFFSGDYNQTVNPTYFNTHRIKTLFTIVEEDFKEYSLDLNYRSHKEIVKLSQRVSDLRVECLYQDRKNDYRERYIESDDTRNYRPILLRKSDENKRRLFEIASTRHYVAVIVADESEKNHLINDINIDGFKENIFTVPEIKGIEKQVIICYNLISRHKDIWKEIMRLEGKEKFEKQYIYRPYFNSLYVAITRARKQVCFYEENRNELYDILADNIDIVDAFDENRFNLSTVSTSDEFLKEGFEYEKQEKYESAIEMYMKSSAEGRYAYKSRCEAYIAKEREDDDKKVSEKFEAAGKALFKLREFKSAGECYNESNNIIGQIKCMLALEKDYDYIEKLCAEIDKTVIEVAFETNGFNSYRNETVILNFLKLYNKKIDEISMEKVDRMIQLENLDY